MAIELQKIAGGLGDAQRRHVQAKIDQRFTLPGAVASGVLMGFGGATSLLTAFWYFQVVNIAWGPPAWIAGLILSSVFTGVLTGHHCGAWNVREASHDCTEVTLRIIYEKRDELEAAAREACEQQLEDVC